MGNALEIDEALRTLEGRGPEDLTAASRAVAAAMFTFAFPEREGEADDVLREALSSGEARRRFDAMAAAQGAVDGWPEKLPRAKYARAVKADRDGVIRRLDAYAVARAVGVLGGARKTKDEVIDAGAGAVLYKKVGDAVEINEPIMTLYSNNRRSLPAAEEWVVRGLEVGPVADRLDLDLRVIR